MTKIRFFCISAFILVSAALIVMFFKGRSSPNIILIVLDAARPDHFSCYGYEKDTTPRMDAMSRKGAIFLNHFSNTTFTQKAIPQIFFSRYYSSEVFQKDAWLWGVKLENSDSIFREFDDEQIFLTEVLSRRGYRTAAFHNHAWFAKETYLAHRFDESFSFEVQESHPMDGEIITALVSWLRENRKRRFFVYCHIMSPHEPYPTKKEDSEFLEGDDRSTFDIIRRKLSLRKDDSAEGWNQDQLRILRGLYDGNLKHSDKWIGILFDKLRELGLEGRTAVIITSDHGEGLGQHNHLTHGGLPWDSVTRIPLIMVCPRLIAPGTRVSALTESIDIAPTILDISKIELTEGKKMDGVSLLEVMHNPEAGKEAVFTNDSIRTVEHKYILSKDLLYNLRKDPEEKENIAATDPLMKEKLQIKYEETMRPYEKRYSESKRTEPPDYPFYFEITSFRLSPEDAFEGCHDTRSNAIVLKEASPTKSWLLNKHWYRTGLFCLPKSGPPPVVTLSARLPNGSYRISALLESDSEIKFSLAESGFQYRFEPQGSFALPRRIAFEKETNDETFCYYLHLNETTVKDEEFSIEIDFHPPDENLYVIRYIRFIPTKYDEKERAKGLDKDEIRRKIEELKSLGYM